VLEPEVIRDAVIRACRAPSLHNSQAWHWVAESGRLHLLLDREPLVVATDRSGREMILSCGAALDHLRVAMAATGWDTTIHRFPDPNEANHLAMLDFSPRASITDAERQRAGAILRRRTDRLPFAAPSRWESLERQLRGRVDHDAVMLDVLPDDAREQLAEASRLTEAIRHNDPLTSRNYGGGHRLSNWIMEYRRARGCLPRRPAVLTWHELSRQLDTENGARRSVSTAPRSSCFPRAMTPARRCCGVARRYPLYCLTARSPGWRRAP
jgi:hypothetical protein